MKRLRVFASGILAGVCIAVGGTAFLSLDSKALGALFFTAGLFTICTFELHLFTGKVCYVLEKDRVYALDLPVIWLGNFAGTWAVALGERNTRIGVVLAERAADLCEAKLADSVSSIFLLAVFCNILIYIAVEGFRGNPHELGKYLSLFFGVIVFILCGFEHCVANMYYFSIAGIWSGKALLYILAMTLGNVAGGVTFPWIRSWLKSERSTLKN